MKNLPPTETGRLYDAIADWWDDQQQKSTAGLRFVERAVGLCTWRRWALDVGYGSGGRIVTALAGAGFEVVGLDISKTMVQLARARHTGSSFIHADICEWRPAQPYDVIIAWDSIFHVPQQAQRHVVDTLCGALADNGVVMFTAGGVDGETIGEMCGQRFYYSSLTETHYLGILQEAGCQCVLMERDQYPEPHVVFIAVKRAGGRAAPPSRTVQ